MKPALTQILRPTPVTPKITLHSIERKEGRATYTVIARLPSYVRPPASFAPGKILEVTGEPHVVCSVRRGESGEIGDTSYVLTTVPVAEALAAGTVATPEKPHVAPDELPRLVLPVENVERKMTL